MRSYNQICGLAGALDILGERWALLVVRELLLGPKRYGDLAGALPGIGTNILADRLKLLTGAGVVRRTTLPPPANVPVYELTERGEGLRPILLSLALWGLPLIPEDPSTGHARATWAAMTMAAVMDQAGAPAGLRTIGFAIDDERFHVHAGEGDTRVHDGAPPGPADLELSADLMTFLSVASGRRPAREALRDGDLVVVAGAKRDVDRLFGAFRLPL